jgi:hypothetical protein
MSAGSLPLLNSFAADAYEWLAPIAQQDADNGYVIAAIMGACGRAFDQAEAVSRALPGRQPYQQVYDVTQCPDERVPGLLGWLGQFVGVPWVPYSDSVAKRTQVQAEAQFYRGSPGNVLAAVGATLTDPTRVSLSERTPDAWGAAVVYDPIYCPDPTATANAAAEAIPWALNLTVTSSSVPIWEEGTLTFEAVSPSTVTFESATYAQVT